MNPLPPDSCPMIPPLYLPLMRVANRERGRRGRDVSDSKEDENMLRFVVVLMIVGSAYAQRKNEDPIAHLPKNVEVLTYFGERADISPDNKRIAFMNKSF